MKRIRLVRRIRGVSLSLCLVMLLLLFASCASPEVAGGTLKEPLYLEEQTDLPAGTQEEVPVTSEGPGENVTEDIPEGALPLTDVGEIPVKQWQRFQFIMPSISDADKSAWKATRGESPDGLWTFKLYDLQKDVYLHAFNSSGNATFNAVKEGGVSFAPPVSFDVVKVFTCPSGGTVRLENVIRADDDDFSLKEGNGVSFSVYLDGELVYPADGTLYEVITSPRGKYREIELEVKKNQKIYFHLGSRGNNHDEYGYMRNSVVYESVNDAVSTYYVPRTCTHEKMLPTECVMPAGCLKEGYAVSYCADCIHGKFTVIPKQYRSYQIHHICEYPFVNVTLQPTLSSGGQASFVCRDLCPGTVTGYVPPSAYDAETGLFLEVLNFWFPQGTEMKVRKVTEDSDDWATEVAPLLSDGEKARVYYLTFLNNGEVVHQVNQRLRVTVPRDGLPRTVTGIWLDGLHEKEFFPSVWNEVIDFEITGTGYVILKY